VRIFWESQGNGEQRRFWTLYNFERKSFLEFSLGKIDFVGDCESDEEGEEFEFESCFDWLFSEGSGVENGSKVSNHLNHFFLILVIYWFLFLK